ncbi:MAG TPA: nuclear transport factor 2 family protein, partial [Polyangia bacterium]|nr:nuclear transport factor 2 family protein [Polyangia bacterium]
MSVLEQYRGLYSAIERRDEGDVAARLEALYDPRLMFQDTFVTVLGRDEFVEMNRRALKNTRAIETEIFESSETAEQLFMTWKMRYVTRL